MRIPTYDRPTVRDSGQPLEYIRNPQQNYVGAQGAALSQLGGAMQGSAALATKFAIQRQQEDDTATAYDAYYKMSNWTTETIHGDNGLFRLKGANARGVSDKYTDLHRQQFDKLTEGMTAGAKAVFSRLEARNFSNTVGQIGKFEADQRQAFTMEAASSAASAAVNQYVTSLGDPDVHENTLNVIDDAINVTLAGSDATTKANKRLELTSQMHGQVLDSLIDQSAELGEAYLDVYREEMTGEEIGIAKKKLEAAESISRIQGYVNELDFENLNQTQALAAMREKLPHEDQKAAAQEIKTRYTEIKNAQTELENKNFDDVLSVINDGGTPTASQWASLSERDELSLRGVWSSQRKGEKVETDFVTWNKITQMDEKEFAALNLNRFVGQISTTDLKGLREDQKAIQSGKSFTGTNIMAPSANARNYLKNQNIDVDSDAGMLFIRKAQSEITAIEDAKGQKATPEEVSKIYDRLMQEVRIDVNWGWNSKKHLFEVDDNQKLEVPDDVLEKLEAALKRANMPITEDAVQLYYRMSLNK